MNARSVFNRAGYTGLLLTMLFTMTTRAKGAQVTATMTGIVVDGYDQFHMFGVGEIQKNTDNSYDLKGQPFTLVYTFDDTKGNGVGPKPSCPNSGSGISGDFATSPGIAVLTIGALSVTIGTRKDSHSETWRSISVPCSQSQISFEVHEGRGMSDIGKRMVNVTLLPTKGTRTLTQDPDWKHPLSNQAMDNWGGFFLSKPGDSRHETKGNLEIRTLVITRK